MEPLDIKTVASFFDEIDEIYLTPFDWCPNEKLPRDQRKTYRLKDLFISKYRKKICRYTQETIEDCRTEFHYIFRDNIMHMIQCDDEFSKLKKMGDGDMYDAHTNVTRTVDLTNTNTSDGSITSVNKGKITSKQGALAGSVDAVQLGTILDESQRIVNTDLLLDKFDENVRQYNQNAGINDEVTNVTVTDTNRGSGTTTTKGTQMNHTYQGVQALNEVRAHSLEVRRLREEMIQCFNVLYY